MSDDLVIIMIEVETDLLREVEKVLKPYGMTPEQVAVEFLYFCVNPAHPHESDGASLAMEKRAGRKRVKCTPF